MRSIVKLIVVLACLGAIAAPTASHALPPPSWCGGPWTISGTTCTFTHLDPVAYHNGIVVGTGSGPVTVKLFGPSGLLLQCSGTSFCINTGLLTPPPGTYTCQVTGTGPGQYACVVY